MQLHQMLIAVESVEVSQEDDCHRLGILREMDIISVCGREFELRRSLANAQ